jgi:hypothetical protein
MVGCPNHASGIKISNRIRPSGLKIKTSAPDTSTSDTKSPAITSTDWRKRAAAISSPGVSTKRSKQSYDASDDISIRLSFEPDTSFAGPQYRYPREKKAPWENVFSAPAWQIPSSSSSTSGDEAKEMTKVQLKHVNPVITTVNGEDISLPNRFSFDVTVVDPRNASPGLGLGELQRLNGRAPFRRPLLREDSDDLMVKLQEIVGRQQDSLSAATSASSEFRDYPDEARFEQRQDGSDSAISGFATVATESSYTHSEPLSDEEARFQRMLGRLQGQQEDTRAPQTTQDNNDATLRPTRVVDPAIVAMKVGKVEVLEQRTQSGPDTEAANVFFARQLDHFRNAHQNSTDSGYGSNDREHGSSDRQTPNESSLDNVQRVLNPAAAEFKATGQSEEIPWLASKKMSRPPLTNIFPDVMSSYLFPHAFAPGSTLPPECMPIGLSVTRAQHHGDGMTGNDAQPQPQPAQPVSALTLAMDAINAYHFLEDKAMAHQAVQPGATVSAATLGAAPLRTGFTPPSTTTAPSHANKAFHTFPPTAPAPPPALYQPVPSTTTFAGGIPPSFLPAAVPIPQPPQPLPTTTTNKPSTRPYFPVTTKPRDHDPVKQQMYEAYLEWRKANEPGYHMKCKMRQANRVMRQCQLQQQPPSQSQSQSQQPPENCHGGGLLGGDGGVGQASSSSSSSSWKVIAERAKAAMGAAAAAVEEERRRREEGVRDELRRKVRELSREATRVLGGV